jgi:hypothetical protein
MPARRKTLSLVAVVAVAFTLLARGRLRRRRPTPRGRCASSWALPPGARPTSSPAWWVNGSECLSRQSDREGAACRPGETPLGRSPAHFARLVAEETEKWGRVVRFSGARAGPRILRHARALAGWLNVKPLRSRVKTRGSSMPQTCQVKPAGAIVRQGGRRSGNPDRRPRGPRGDRCARSIRASSGG